MDNSTDSTSDKKLISWQEAEKNSHSKMQHLPPVLLKKHRPQSENVFVERSETQVIPTLSFPYNNYEKKGKISFREHRLERFTRAEELPLGLALKLTKDVIKMERRIKEESMMKEIRKKRKEYEMQKNKAVSERLASFSTLSLPRGFSYFPPLENKYDKAATMKKRHDYFEATVNHDRFSDNKKMALDKMRAFGLRHKSRGRKSNCRNSDH